MEGKDPILISPQQLTSECTKEKQQAHMITLYNQALRLLQQSTPHALEKAKGILHELMASSLINDDSLIHLKASLMLSHAQLAYKQRYFCQALAFWHRSTQLGNILNSDFITWVKIANCIQSNFIHLASQNKEMGIYQWQNQLQNAYKQAIRLSPTLWRDKLVNKLLDIYNKNGKSLQFEELSQMMWNQGELKDVIDHVRESYEKVQKIAINMCQKADSNHGEGNFTECVIKVPIYMLLGSQNCCSICLLLWEYILAFSCIVIDIMSGKQLKFEENSKNKKHAQIIQILAGYLSDCNHSKTKIEFITHNDSPDFNGKNLETLQNQHSKPAQNQQLTPTVACFDKQAKNLHELIIDTVKQSMDKGHWAQSGKNKKHITVSSHGYMYSNKSAPIYNKVKIYESIQEYYLENCKNKGIGLKFMRGLRQLDRTGLLYEKVFEMFEEEPSGAKILDKDQLQNRSNVDKSATEDNKMTESADNIITRKKNTAENQSKNKQIQGNKVSITLFRARFKAVVSQLVEKSSIYSIELLQFVMQTAIEVISEHRQVLIKQQIMQNDTFNLQSETYMQLLGKALIGLSNVTNYIEYYAQQQQKWDQICYILGEYIELESEKLARNIKIRELKEALEYYRRFDRPVQDTIADYRSQNVKNSNLSSDKIKKLLSKCVVTLKTSSIPNFLNEARINSTYKVYEFLYVKYHQFASKQDETNHSLPTPIRLQQLISARIKKSKINALTKQINHSTDEPAGKKLNWELSSGVKNSRMSINCEITHVLQQNKQHININSHLQSFINTIHCLQIKLKALKFFNKKSLSKIFKSMEISAAVEVLHKKLVLFATNKSQDQICLQAKLSTMYYLIKIVLLDQLDCHVSEICLRVVFFLFEQIIQPTKILIKTLKAQESGLRADNPIEIEDNSKHMQQQRKNDNQQSMHNQLQSPNSKPLVPWISLCDIVFFIDSLIKRNDVDLRKKFCHRVLLKNIRQIYQQQPYMQSSQHSSKNLTETNQQIREIKKMIFKTYSAAFDSKIFKPQKIEDCLGYFFMISQQFASALEKDQVQFDSRVKKLLEECYKIFMEQYANLLPFCHKYRDFVANFHRVMKGELKLNSQFCEKCLGKIFICQCCQKPFLNPSQIAPFPPQTLYVAAKYIQNRTKTAIQMALQTNFIPKNHTIHKDLLEQQNLYMVYLLSTITTNKSWKQLIRSNVNKVYYYFDALFGVVELQKEKEEKQKRMSIAQCIDQPKKRQKKEIQSPNNLLLLFYRNQFKYTKKLINFIMENLGSILDQQTKIAAEYHLALINTIKIGQRKYYKQLISLQNSTKVLTTQNEKYIQGILTILDSGICSMPRYREQLLEIRYLTLVEYYYPFLLDKFSLAPTSKPMQKFNKLKIISMSNQQFVQFVMGESFEVINSAMIQYRKQQESEKGESKRVMFTAYRKKHLGVQIIIDLYTFATNLTLLLLQNIAELSNKINNANQPEIAADFKKTLTEQLNNVPILNTILIKLSQRHILGQWIIAPPLQTALPQFSATQPDEMIHYLHQQLHKLCEIFQKVTDLTHTNVSVMGSLNFNSILKTKKQMHCRFVFMANLMISKIKYASGDYSSAFQALKEVVTLKNEDFVHLYHHYEKQATESNEILAEFYSRSIVFNCTKMDAIQHILKVLSKQQSLQTLILMTRKLGKVYSFRINNNEKQSNFNKNKQSKKPDNPDKQPEQQAPQQSNKQKSDKKTKKTDKKQKQYKPIKIDKKVRFYFIIFIRAVEIFIETFKSRFTTMEKQLENREERALREFLNKLKRQAERQVKKTVNSEITLSEQQFMEAVVSHGEQVLQLYEKTFNKVIKMKKSKKIQTQQRLQYGEPSKHQSPSIDNNHHGHTPKNITNIINVTIFNPMQKGQQQENKCKEINENNIEIADDDSSSSSDSKQSAAMQEQEQEQEAGQSQLSNHDEQNNEEL